MQMLSEAIPKQRFPLCSLRTLIVLGLLSIVNLRFIGIVEFLAVVSVAVFLLCFCIAIGLCQLYHDGGKRTRLWMGSIAGVVLVACGILMWRYMNHISAINAIRKSNGQVIYAQDAIQDAVLELNSQSVLSDEFANIYQMLFARVECVQLRFNSSDKVVHALQFKQLNELGFDGCHVIDGNLVHISKLKNLEFISMRNAYIEDIMELDLRKLTTMPRLKRVYISVHSPWTDKFLNKLRSGLPMNWTCETYHPYGIRIEPKNGKAKET